MHARTQVLPAIEPTSSTDAKPGLLPVQQIKAGQHFIRADSPSEVLALMSYAAQGCEGSRYTWAIVIDVNHDSEGYIPGQMLKLRRTALVRRVHQVRSSCYVLEQ